MDKITATVISAIAMDTWIEVKYQLSNEETIRIMRFDVNSTPTEIQERIKIDVEAKQAELDALLPTEIE